MRKTITVLAMMFSLNCIYAQCSQTSIESKYDEFDESVLNETKIVLENDKRESFEIHLRYYSTPLTRKGEITPSIGVSARLLNRGSNPTPVGNSPYIHFLFEDGTSARLNGSEGEHIGHIFKTMIWLKSFHEKSSERLSVLNAVKSKEIKAIRFKRAYDNFDFYLSSTEKTNIQNVFKCITNINL